MSDPKQLLLFAAAILAFSLRLGIVAMPEVELSLPAVSPVAADATASLGEPFTLTGGETVVTDDGFTLTFVSVTEDSRCPADVECVWEGNAEIAIEVSLAGESPILLSLNTNTGFATEAAYLSHTIALIDLEPYPSIESKMNEPHRATLVVNSTGADSSSAPSASPSPMASRGPSDS